MRCLRDGLDHAGVLHREEALRDQDVEHDGQRQREDRDQKRRRLVVEHAVQRAAVAVDHRIEDALGGEIEAAAFGIRTMADQLGAHHRHQGQRHHGGYDDGDGERDREFVEQPADHVAHEQKRDQHRDQRDGQRDDGEADLLGAAQRRLQRLHAVFDIARDVLDHDDGVVDDEAGGDGQRHQRQIVETEAEQIHRAERADDRQWHRQARNDGAGQRAQEHEDHQHDQHDREHQLEFDVGDRGADRHRAVTEDRDVEASGSVAFSCGNSALMPSTTWMMLAPGWRCTLTMIAGVGVGPGAELGVFRPADDGGDIGQPHRRAVAIGDDERSVLIGAGHLIVGVDGQRLVRPVEIALRRIDVEIADRGAHVVDVEAIGGERLRIDLDAHRGPLAAGDADQADAGQLRDFLREPAFRSCLRPG